MSSQREVTLTQPALIPVAGYHDRKPRSLDRDVTSIGRARGSDLWLEANEISTLHCVIYRTHEGFRIRDCNSRTGTRINGESVKNHALHDGDIINLGPFSFEVRIPAVLFPKDSAKLDPVKVGHWQNSRRKLALRALKLRERLRDSHLGSSAREEELAQKAHLLKDKIRSYDHRSSELEAAERELTEERDKLAREKEAHRGHVQTVEKSLSQRFTQAEAEIHQRWQEFQHRCQVEEARLKKLASSLPAHLPSQSPEAFTQQKEELAAQHKRADEHDQRLAQLQQQLLSERQEFLTMKDQWVKDQAQAMAALEAKKAALAQQKAEIVRMMGDLKKMQEEVRRHAKGDVPTLQFEIDRLHAENAELQAKIQREDNSSEVQTILTENEKLRHLVHELEQKPKGASSREREERTVREIQELRAEVERVRAELHDKELQIQELNDRPDADAPAGANSHAHQLQAENQLLKKLLQDKDQYLQELKDKEQQRPKTESDLERYEAELNTDRRQLEVDRAKLKKELDTLRELKQEIEEQESQMEMNMSKERAELGRERMRLERVREEIKGDMERLQREIAVRDSMAPVQKLRDELTSKQAGSGGKTDKALNDRLRSFRTQLNDTPPQNAGS